ncbi:MAG TPA: VanW family protein [Candidatus Dormibacteraeota bacterium]|nr:VanW family protein [Candidatus Dormibacteraeota bacterium]
MDNTLPVPGGDAIGAEPIAWDGVVQPVATSRRRRLARAAGVGMLGVLLGALAAMCFAAAFLVGLALAYQGRVLPGVEVGGVSLAGLDRAGALAALQAGLPPTDTSDLVLEVGSTRDAVPLASLGRRYDLDAAVDAALAYGRDGSALERGLAEVRGLVSGAEAASPVTYDESALSEYLYETAFSVARSPQDGQVLWASGTPYYVLQPAVVGQRLDLAATRRALVAALRLPSTGDIDVVGTVLVTPPAVSTAAARTAMDRAVELARHPLALRYGSRSWTLARPTIAGSLTFTADGNGGYGVGVDAARIKAALAGVGKAVAKAPKNAVFVTKGGKVVGVVASTTGASLDGDITASRITTQLLGLAPGATPAPVQLAVASVAPQLDAGSAAAYLPRMTLLGTWTTPYVPSEKNFWSKNITIPTNIINGYVLLPGQWFDFLKVVSITSANGFGPGGFIRNGHTDPTGALGGGICSCSTTIFNAALRAGLQMGARRNHYYYINRYPVGLDATVWIESGGSKQTVTFRNDTGGPILIRGINTYGHVTFQVYGVNDGRRTVLSTPIVKNYNAASDGVAYTSSLPKGVSKRVEWPAPGFDSWVTRTVYAADGHVIHRETYFSHYSRVDGLTLIGTG